MNPNENPFKTPFEARCHLRANELVNTERLRQIEEEGHDCAHDDTHGMEEMATAAAIYLLPDIADQDVAFGTSEGGIDTSKISGLLRQMTFELPKEASEVFDPFDLTGATLAKRIDHVAKGAALALAELERLIRLRDLEQADD